MRTAKRDYRDIWWCATGMYGEGKSGRCKEKEPPLGGAAINKSVGEAGVLNTPVMQNAAATCEHMIAAFERLQILPVLDHNTPNRQELR